MDTAVGETPLPETPFEPRIVAFACHWCTYSGADLAGLNRMNYPANVKLLRVPCSGRVNPQYVLTALNKGCDGVLVCGCHPGDCHYATGNYFAKRRLMAFKRLLEFSGLQPERFQVRWISGSEAGKFRDTVIQVCEEIRALGPLEGDSWGVDKGGTGDGSCVPVFDEAKTGTHEPSPCPQPSPPSPLSTPQNALRERARELLQSGEVSLVIGWGATRFENRTTPLFVTQAEEAEQLLFNEYCTNTLAKYAVREKELTSGRIALATRGCESRAVNRMLADRQLQRSDLVLLGLPCSGMRDDATGAVLTKCATCTHRNPVVFDEMLGEPAPEEEVDRFEELRGLEALDIRQRLAWFDAAWMRCIRCYACREVCPVCTCRECFVDQERVGWQGKQANRAENRFYNLTRVFHIGDRCIECGECERACPMGLPLMALNRKFVSDLDTLFASGEAGLSDEADNALGRYDLADTEEFM
ncbi:MAG: hydrogenase iron-sulfur subunit [Coriobacteriales bacterium]|jgi:coenzyme F420-reducing hydrogenase delta subunit/ferredoxin|nr:hydrogenase iron-sulfur subunit [Coriobacteriales bacterium]